MLYVFLKLKEFPKINSFIVLLLILLLTALTILDLPTKFLMSYSNNDMSMYIQLKTLSFSFNYWTLLLITYIKYFKLSKKDVELTH